MGQEPVIADKTDEFLNKLDAEKREYLERFGKTPVVFLLSQFDLILDPKVDTDDNYDANMYILSEEEIAELLFLDDEDFEGLSFLTRLSGEFDLDRERDPNNILEIASRNDKFLHNLGSFFNAYKQVIELSEDRLSENPNAITILTNLKKVLGRLITQEEDLDPVALTMWSQINLSLLGSGVPYDDKDIIIGKLIQDTDITDNRFNLPEPLINLFTEKIKDIESSGKSWLMFGSLMSIIALTVTFTAAHVSKLPYTEATLITASAFSLLPLIIATAVYISKVVEKKEWTNIIKQILEKYDASV